MTSASISATPVQLTTIVGKNASVTTNGKYYAKSDAYVTFQTSPITYNVTSYSEITLACPGSTPKPNEYRVQVVANDHV